MNPAISVDELLSTTRTVRRRLDLERPVDMGLIDECLQLAQQAPSGGNRQTAVFVVVTDAELRAEIGEAYRRGFERYRRESVGSGPPTAETDPAKRRPQARIATSAKYLAQNMHRVPVHVIPCVRPRTDDAPPVVQASTFGSVLPAAWSFMLAARARGLGTAWTTVHLFCEDEVARLLGIPDDHMQVALIPTAHYTGEGFAAGPRNDLDAFRRINGW